MEAFGGGGSVTLKGNSQETVDTFTWVILSVIVGGSFLFYLGQKLQIKLLKIPVRPSRTGVPRTKNWVICSFIICYGLLIPGLVCTLVSYNISALSGMITLKDASKTMITFVGLLAESDAWLGAVLVVVYAMIIPAVKLCLLILTEVWRRGTPQQVMRARSLIHVLQFISKWASPDMFAYILLIYLIRSLDHPPMLAALAEVDIGFTCFAVFCVGSTVAALGLEPPPLPEGAKPEAKPQLCRMRPGTLAAIVALLCAAFVPLLVCGLRSSSMSLHINTDALYEPNGPLDPSLKPMVDVVVTEDIGHAQVSIWRCINKLYLWTSEGEANSFIGFVLFAFGIIAATALDMLTLLSASLLMCRKTHPAASEAAPAEVEAPAEAPTEAAAPGAARAVHHSLIRLAKVLKKLSFLDVYVVGIVVVVMSGQAYRSQGLVLEMEEGLLLLLGAEVCHYLAYYLVVYAAEPTADADDSEARELGKLPNLLQSVAAPPAVADAKKQPPQPQAGVEAAAEEQDLEEGQNVQTLTDGAAAGRDELSGNVSTNVGAQDGCGVVAKI